MSASLGFWIRGPVYQRRQLVEHAAAFRAYCELDVRIDPSGESYLSAFSFGPEFCDHLDRTGSTRAYAGVTGAAFVWWDIDRADDLERALSDARRLAAMVLDRVRSLDESDLLVFYSGSKGFHIGMPTFWDPEPTTAFHRAARRFAERFADEARVAIDRGIYDVVRPFRCPNNRHPKTGLFKRRLDYDALMTLSLDGIKRLAAIPEPFDLTTPRPSADDIATMRRLWSDAVGLPVENRSEGADARPPTADRLNRATLDFIRDGATVGDRHRILFSAAANLAEFGATYELVYALLADAALDSGLAPNEVRRQIECGLAHAKGQTR